MSGWDDKDDTEPTPVSPAREGERALGDGDTLVFGLDPSGSGGVESNFDYAAFEASLDDIRVAEAQAAPPPAPAPAGPVERQTVPRRIHPDDATHTVRPVGRFSYVTVQGRINESFDGDALGQQLRGAAVVFDLADVDRITSFGVRGWLKMIQVAGLSEAYFVRCSESVVNQITMIHNFCGPARVHSLIAPYLCPSCGAEFGVVYEAVADSAILRGRRPPEVLCPECAAAAELDEDPWAFFDFDQQLLEAVPDELQKVLDLLSTEPRHAPIEKFVSGGTTRVAFNGDLSEKTRFHRPLSGIEGVVIIDLVHIEQASADGLRRLVEALEQVSADVSQFRFEGVTPDLARILLELRPDKAVVASIHFPATNHAGIRRSVVVDAVTNRGSLLQSRSPRVDAAWAQAGITLDDPSLAQRLVDAMGFVPASATPAPMSRNATPGPSSYHQMTPAPAFDQYGMPPGSFHGATPAPVMVTYAPPPPPSPKSQLILGVSLVLVVSAMAVFLIALTVIITSTVARRNTQPVAEVEAPAPQAAAAVAPAVGEWSSGGTSPPMWASSPVMQSDTQLLLLGSGQGASAEAAREGAKNDALLHLAQYINQQIAGSAAAPGLSAFPMPQDAAAVAMAMQTGGTPMPLMEESQSATREVDGKYEIYTQYSIDKTNLAPFANHFTATADFRGLIIAETPPWAPVGVRLVSSPTWWAVPAGSRVNMLAGTPVSTLPMFMTRATATYDELAPGADFVISFTTVDGSASEIRVSKKAAAATAKPKPVLLKMDGAR